jgi:hypothetical protein
MGFKDKLSTTVGTGGSRDYFKPAEHKSAYVLFIEPKSARNEPNRFYKPGKDNERRANRDVVTCDITVFETPEHLEAAQPTAILTDTQVTDIYLAADFKTELGKFVIGRIEQRSNGAGNQPSWVFRATDTKVIDLVERYYDKREAELDAAEADFSNIDV